MLLKEFFALADVPVWRRSPQQVSRLEALAEAPDDDLAASSSQPSRRKRKKKRKKRLPRTRCLPRGFAGGDAPRVMFPSVVVRPEMLCIMADMDQKDSTLRATLSVAFVSLVLLVALHTTLCSFTLSSGSGCSASWPRRLRRTVMQLVSCLGLVLLVTLHLALCSLCFSARQAHCRPANDARHHGRYGSEEHVLSYLPQVQLLDKVVVPVVCTTNALIQIVAPCRKLWNIRSCSSFSRSSSSRRCAETGSHGLTVQQTTENLLLQYIDKVFDDLVVQSSRFLGCSRGEDGLDPTVAPRSRVQTWRRGSRSHSCSFDAGHCRSHACCCATTGAGDGRDSAVNCGGSAVGAHRLAWFFRAVYTGTRLG